MSTASVTSRDEILASVGAGTLSVDEARTLLSTATIPQSVLESIGPLSARTFSTGSRGYWATGKVNINGERCQVSITATVIGSKPKKGE